MKSEEDEGRFFQLHGIREHRRSLLALYQSLVEPARGGVPKDLGEHGDGAEIRIRSRRCVVARVDDLDISAAANDHFSLPVLHGFLCVGDRQHTVRPADRAEELAHSLQGFRFINPAAHEENRVVGLVILLEEGGQPLDVHVLDIAPIADGRFAVVVPVVRRRQHPLVEHGSRPILTGLEFVADNGHLRLEFCRGSLRIDSHPTVDHPVRFHPQGPTKVFVRGLEGFEIVGPIEGGLPIGTRAVLGQFLRDVRMGGRALEEHVLQQMGHARLAVVLVAAAHQVGDVDRDRRLAGVREKKHPQPVR